MAVINTVPGVLRFDSDRVKLAIPQRRRKCQTVLATNKLNDFSVRTVEVLRSFRKADVTASGYGKLVGRLVSCNDPLSETRSEETVYRSPQINRPTRPRHRTPQSEKSFNRALRARQTLSAFSGIFSLSL